MIQCSPGCACGCRFAWCAVGRTPRYEKRVVPPLSDGRTPGVCANCGAQHPGPRFWRGGSGCYADGAVCKAPQPRSDDFIRASGDCVCEACNRRYQQHPPSDDPRFMTTDALGHVYSWVRVLCDGTKVKL